MLIHCVCVSTIGGISNIALFVNDQCQRNELSDKAGYRKTFVNGNIKCIAIFLNKILHIFCTVAELTARMTTSSDNPRLTAGRLAFPGRTVRTRSQKLTRTFCPPDNRKALPYRPNQRDFKIGSKNFSSVSLSEVLFLLHCQKSVRYPLCCRFGSC